MAITQSSIIKRVVPGDRYDITIVALLDAAYPNTGTTVGYPLTIGLFGFQSIISGPVMVLDNCDCTALGYLGFIDPTTGNLRVVISSTGAEVANGVSLAAVKFRLQARGV